MENLSYYKNRKIDKNRPVEVYRNLTKNCWSLRQDRLVRAHASEVYLTNCKFVVVEKYRDRVRRTKRKCVHAWVKGNLTCDGLEALVEVVYNPYTYNHFTVKDSNTKITEANAAILKEGKVYVDSK